MSNLLKVWMLKIKTCRFSSVILFTVACFGLPQIAIFLSSFFVMIFNEAIYDLFDIQGGVYTLRGPKILTLINGAIIAYSTIFACGKIWRSYERKIHGFVVLMAANAAAFCFFVLTKLPSFLAILNNFFIYIGFLYIIALIEIVVYSFFLLRYNERSAPSYKSVTIYALLSIFIVSILLFLFLDFGAVSSFISMHT